MGKIHVQEISAKGVYRLNYRDPDFELQGNTYLVVDSSRDKTEGVLIDPGSLPGFPALKEAVDELLDGGQLTYVVLQHQDPDICACLPLLEKHYANIQLVAHWRAAVLIKYYGLDSPFYYADQKNFLLQLHSGRNLLFFHTPYAHSPASLMTYDETSQVLFTGDLFATFSMDSFTENEIEEVGEEYFNSMVLFHENYIPSREVINAAMEMVQGLVSGPGIEMLASQHGTPIPKNKIQLAVDQLKDLECGEFLTPIVSKIYEPERAYFKILSQTIEVLKGVFGKSKWLALLAENNITTPEGNIKEDRRNAETLEELLSLVFSLGGYVILDSLKNRVLRHCNTYNLPLPAVFSSDDFRGAEKQILDYKNIIQFMSGQVDSLQEEAFELEAKVKSINNAVNRDSLTGLFDKSYSLNFLTAALDDLKKDGLKGFFLLAVSIDDINLVNDRHGEKKGDRVIGEVALLLQDFASDNDILFRLQGPTFLIFMPETDRESCLEKAEKIKNIINKEHFDSIRITVSLALEAISPKEMDFYVNVNSLIDNILAKLTRARELGGNRLIEKIDVSEIKCKKALIADDNSVSQKLLSRIVEKLGFEPLVAGDGIKALEILKNEEIKLVLVESMLPKKDGFYILDYTRYYSASQDVPVVLFSTRNDHNEIVRALEEGAIDYILKPFHFAVVEARLRKRVGDVNS